MASPAHVAPLNELLVREITAPDVAPISYPKSRPASAGNPKASTVMDDIVVIDIVDVVLFSSSFSSALSAVLLTRTSLRGVQFNEYSALFEFFLCFAFALTGVLPPLFPFFILIPIVIFFDTLSDIAERADLRYGTESICQVSMRDLYSTSMYEIACRWRKEKRE